MIRVTMLTNFDFPNGAGPVRLHNRCNYELDDALASRLLAEGKAILPGDLGPTGASSGMVTPLPDAPGTPKKKAGKQT